MMVMYMVKDIIGADKDLKHGLYHKKALLMIMSYDEDGNLVTYREKNLKMRMESFYDTKKSQLSLNISLESMLKKLK